MAATSTARTACNAAIWLDNSSGTLTDISGSMNQVTIAPVNALGDYRVFGTPHTYRTECGKDATFTLNIVYSTANTEGAECIHAWIMANPSGNRSLSIYLPDKNVGSEHFSCEAKIESSSVTGDAGEAGPMVVTATLKPDGPVSYTVVTT